MEAVQLKQLALQDTQAPALSYVELGQTHLAAASLKKNPVAQVTEQTPLFSVNPLTQLVQVVAEVALHFRQFLTVESQPEVVQAPLRRLKPLWQAVTVVAEEQVRLLGRTVLQRVQPLLESTKYLLTQLVQMVLEVQVSQLAMAAEQVWQTGLVEVPVLTSPVPHCSTQKVTPPVVTRLKPLAFSAVQLQQSKKMGVIGLMLESCGH